MISYMVGNLVPYSSHSTRGLVKYVPGRGYFRAVSSQNGDKNVTSPSPPIVELVFRPLHDLPFCFHQQARLQGPHWPVVLVLVASAVFCVICSLGWARMRCTSIISRAFATTATTTPRLGLRLTSSQDHHWPVVSILIASAVFSANASAAP